MSMTTQDKPKYYDTRTDLWQRAIEVAEPFDTYLANSDPDKAARWVEQAERLPPLAAAQVERLHGHNRKLTVLFYSGIWCGDCARQGPMLKRITDAAGDGVQLLGIDRDAMPELKDELRLLGAMRVPVAVFLTEDLHEVGRFGDRTLSVYRRKLEQEQGAACGLPGAAIPVEQLQAEQAEWVDVVEQMLIMTRLAPPLRERYGD